MVRCDICGKGVYLPHKCSYCGGTFCDGHRLPEKHFCSNIPTKSPNYPRRVARRASPPDYSKRRYSAWQKEDQSRKKIPLSVIFVTSLLVACGVYYMVSWGVSPPRDTLPSLSPFESVDDLIKFLDNDNVSTYIYASDFKCGDFAEALVERAHDAGYDLRVYSMFGSELDGFIKYVESLEYVRVEDGVTITTKFNYGLGAGHAICKTWIGSKIYLIEPQDDMVFEVIGNGCEIVYFGEVTK